MPVEIKTFLIVAAVCFVCFRIYRRVRGSIGRQRLQRAWLVLRTLLLLLTCGVVLMFSAGDITQTALYAAGGALAGAIIAVYALRHTEVEKTPHGHFYTGHPYIGLGILGLFIARLVFVLTTTLLRRAEIAAEVKSHGGSIASALAQSEGGPLTLGVLALMTGYYIVYSLGLLQRAK